MIVVRDMPGGRFAPFILCDMCKEPITKHGNVEAVWRTDGHPEPVFHTHKGACSDRLRQRDPAAAWRWDELDVHLVFLVHNARIDWTAAHERADLTESIP